MGKRRSNELPEFGDLSEEEWKRVLNVDSLDELMKDDDVYGIITGKELEQYLKSLGIKTDPTGRFKNSRSVILCRHDWQAPP